MRVFLAGATGAIGSRLLPMLTDAGHEVVGSTRDESRAERIRAAGGVPVVMDGLDRDSVLAAVADAKPDVVVHQLTALAGDPDMKHFDRYFATTNELRTRGTDYLLEAAREAGARRFLAQSYVGWNNERTGSPVKDESDPLDPSPTAASVQTMEGIRYVERVVPSAPDLEGVVLRYGSLYGPGTGLAVGGALVELVQKRQLPVVGGGGGIWSFVHVDDAAAATLQALEHGAPGIYNVVDDDPAPVHEWLPYLAEVLGAPRPRSVPAWLAKPLIGEHGVSMMTRIRGAANGKAKRELGWQPRYPSWREGFVHGLA
jgi:nucleoside-diphosphate-sugar epimerase